ncbi:MAG: shikimate dehydrogenase [Prevotella sp.]|jgi:shikimate dehydrogenase|nr:shikimate dehydrogenase [Prevotella sp.]
MDTYGIIGYPLKHSFSKKYFTEKFEKERIDAQYLNFEIADISLFPDILLSHPTMKGFNVTIPYKEKIIPYLTELDPRTKEIGAVNVIKVTRNNGDVKLIGYNSDIIGFQHSIGPLINKEIHHKALILGTGGASKAVQGGLQNLGIEWMYVSRTPKEGQISYKDIDQNVLDEYTIIINASPLGTFPDIENAPDIPYQLLSSKHLLYDLVYNPAETKFLRLGKENGTTIKNGAEMLELQAIAAWKIWNS